MEIPHYPSNREADERAGPLFRKEWEGARVGGCQVGRPDHADRKQLLGMSGQTVRLIRTVESLIEQEKVYLTYYQSYSEFRRALEGIEEIEEQTIQYIAMHGLGLKDVPGLEGENDSDEWKDYLSYTSLIRSEIRQG